MPLDLLVGTIVSLFLVPYVTKGIETMAHEATKEFGKVAGDHVIDVASKVWNRVTSVFSSPSDKTTLEQFEKYPEQAAPLLQAILKEKLEKDPQLQDELQKLVDSPSPDGKGTGAQIMNAMYAGILDARGANFSHAQNLRLSGLSIEQAGAGPSQPTSGPQKPTSGPQDNQ